MILEEKVVEIQENVPENWESITVICRHATMILNLIVSSKMNSVWWLMMINITINSMSSGDAEDYK